MHLFGSFAYRCGLFAHKPRRQEWQSNPAVPPTSPRSSRKHDVRFVRLWFTDVLGQLKSFSINAAELEDAFDGGMGFDGSSITGFNPIEESDMIAMPDPADLRPDPLAPRGRERRRPDVLRHPRPRRRALRGRPALDPAAGAEARRGAGLRRLQHRPRAGVLLLPLGQARGRRARGARRGRLLRPDHARRRLRPAPRDRAGAGEDGHPRRVHPPRGRPLPARGRHALQERAGDGRRLHDLPHRRQGVRDEIRLARDLHAEAAVRRERLRDARPPVAQQRRQERLLRRATTPTSSRRPRSRSSPASSSTRARSRRSSPSGSTPTSGSSPATRRRSTSPGPAATARR